MVNTLGDTDLGVGCAWQLNVGNSRARDVAGILSMHVITNVIEQNISPQDRQFTAKFKVVPATTCAAETRPAAIASNTLPATQAV